MHNVVIIFGYENTLANVTLACCCAHSIYKNSFVGLFENVHCWVICFHPPTAAVVDVIEYILAVLCVCV